MIETDELEVLDAKKPKVQYKLQVNGRRFERPRVKKKAEHSEDQVSMELSKTIIIDNGAYSIKTEVASAIEPKHIPNCIMKAKAEKKRLFIGNQIEECRDCSGLFYLLPCERGYITKWEVQKPIWDYVFNKNICHVSERNILMTQPLFNFKTIQDCIDEIFFEEYEISSMYRCNPTDLAAFSYGLERGIKQATCVVIDSGYSFTHIVPYIHGEKVSNAIKRLQIGGKMLTNYLKDILSYRQYHVMEETYVINQVKEDTCFISENFEEDLKIASESPPKNHIVRNYILPDFNTIKRGYIQEPAMKDKTHENCQVLRLNNERFAVPEILFTPSDIGINSVGIVDCLIDSIKLCPTVFQTILADHIVVIGGNALLPGFQNRLIKEFRTKMPTNWNVNAIIPEKPSIYAWQGGKTLLNQQGSAKYFVTKKEYDELGSSLIQRRFNKWAVFEEEESIKKNEIKPISMIQHVNKFNFLRKNEILTDPNPTGEAVVRSEPLADFSTTLINNRKSIDVTSPTPLNVFDDQSMSTDSSASEKSSGIADLNKTKGDYSKHAYFFENQETFANNLVLLD